MWCLLLAGIKEKSMKEEKLSEISEFLRQDLPVDECSLSQWTLRARRHLVELLDEAKGESERKGGDSGRKIAECLRAEILEKAQGHSGLPAHCELISLGVTATQAQLVADIRLRLKG